MATENSTVTYLVQEATAPSLDQASEGNQVLIQTSDSANANLSEPVGMKSTILLPQVSGEFQGSPSEIITEDGQLIQVWAPIVNDDALVKNSVGVQANDYEIEPRSGVVPVRKRLIPYKFRDYKNLEDVNEEDPDDWDYTPEDQTVKKPRKHTPRPGSRPVGRPRKQRIDHAYDKSDELNKESEEKAEECETHTENVVEIETEVESHQEGGRPRRKVTLQRPTWRTQVLQDDSQRPGFPRRGRPPKDDPYLQPKLFKCLQCSKRFSLKGNLKVHMRTHTDEKPFVCDVENCGKSFRSNDSLRRHTMSHQGLKPYGCEYCDKHFVSKTGLKEHIACHLDVKNLICPICQRAFRQSSCLRRHILTHSNEQPFECTVCGKKFAQMVYLRCHMRAHTGEKPYKCKTCGKGFARQSDVIRHSHIHLGTKPFACEICGARFSDPSTKRRHVKEHTGIKPYPCQLCGDSFKRSGQLKAHLQKNHTNYKDEVLITKEGPFKSLQFHFKGNKSSEIPEQQLQQTDLNEHQYFQVTQGQGAEDLIVLATAAGNESLQVLDGNGQIQQVQVQRIPDPQQNSKDELIQTEAQHPQTDGMQLVISPGNEGNQEELLADTQRIIEQIQLQIDPKKLEGENGSPMQVAYHILHDDANQQIVEIHYQPVPELEGKIHDDKTPTLIHSDQADDNVQGEIDISGEIANDKTRAYSELNADNYISNQDVISMTTGGDFDEQTPQNNLQHSEPNDFNDETENRVRPIEVLNETEEITENSFEGNLCSLATSTTVEISNLPQGDEISQGELRNELAESNSHQEGDTAENVHANSRGGTASVESTLDTSCEAASFNVPKSHEHQQFHQVDYVNHPNFSSQEYYNWLSSFTQFCKLENMPLNAELFQKISQVHKSISDVLATPRGILTYKENFKTLREISKEFSAIIDEHLSFVMQQLDSDVDFKQ